MNKPIKKEKQKSRKSRESSEDENFKVMAGNLKILLVSKASEFTHVDAPDSQTIRFHRDFHSPLKSTLIHGTDTGPLIGQNMSPDHPEQISR